MMHIGRAWIVILGQASSLSLAPELLSLHRLKAGVMIEAELALACQRVSASVHSAVRLLIELDAQLTGHRMSASCLVPSLSP